MSSSADPRSLSSETTSGQITGLLIRWREGDARALDSLTPLVYDELRRLARSRLRKERGERELETTDLVHEAFLRLVDADVSWQSRLHFYALSARLMRRILVDAARERQAAKRGKGYRIETLDEGRLAGRASLWELVALDAALERLVSFDARKARVVELHCFGGLTLRETATFLAISKATVERELKIARAWLARHLRVAEP